jgi:hypothetical protein
MCSGSAPLTEYRKAFGPHIVPHSRSGRLYAVDDNFQTVRMYRTDGTHIADLTRPGDGPLEMRRLESVTTVPSSGEIVVADAFKLKVFALGDSGNIELRRTIQPNAGPSDICAIKQEVFVRIASPRSPHVVFAASVNDTSTLLFGVGLPGPDPYTRATLSEGHMVCTHDPPPGNCYIRRFPADRCVRHDGQSSMEGVLVERPADQLGTHYAKRPRRTPQRSVAT